VLAELSSPGATRQKWTDHLTMTSVWCTGLRHFACCGGQADLDLALKIEGGAEARLLKERASPDGIAMPAPIRPDRGVRAKVAFAA
jgi:hypothetical protein